MDGLISGKWFVSTGKDNLLNAWRTPYGASIFQVWKMCANKMGLASWDVGKGGEHEEVWGKSYYFWKWFPLLLLSCSGKQVWDYLLLYWEKYGTALDLLYLNPWTLSLVNCGKESRRDRMMVSVCFSLNLSHTERLSYIIAVSLSLLVQRIIFCA